MTRRLGLGASQKKISHYFPSFELAADGHRPVVRLQRATSIPAGLALPANRWVKTIIPAGLALPANRWVKTIRQGMPMTSQRWNARFVPSHLFTAAPSFLRRLSLQKNWSWDQGFRGLIMGLSFRELGHGIELLSRGSDGIERVDGDGTALVEYW